MRLIDADALTEHIKTYCDGCNSYGGVMCRACGYGDAIDAIEDAPTIDAIEVVRCKDCKWCINFKGSKLCNHDSGLFDELQDSFYCSYGKREDGDE